MLVVLVLSLVVLVVWFFVAPDPRFVIAPLWLVAIALAAWALPTATRMSPGLLFGALAAAAALAVLGVEHTRLMMPAAIAGWGCLYAAARLLRWRGSAAVLAGAALLSGALAPIGRVADHGEFQPVVANQPGPFGTPLEPVPALMAFQTNFRLRLWEPTNSDQCFGVLLCAPGINPQLQARGASVSDGFRIGG